MPFAFPREECNSPILIGPNLISLANLLKFEILKQNKIVEISRCDRLIHFFCRPSALSFRNELRDLFDISIAAIEQRPLNNGDISFVGHFYLDGHSHFSDRPRGFVCSHLGDELRTWNPVRVHV